MKHRAILKTESRDAGSVAEALQIDNVEMEKLRIKTKARGDMIVSEVETEDLNCLLNTLDDLLHSQMIAEKVI